MEFSWTCCGSTDHDAPGCVVGKHEAYDDPETEPLSPFTGKVLH
jgi:hypothetical protein